MPKWHEFLQRHPTVTHLTCQSSEMTTLSLALGAIPDPTSASARGPVFPLRNLEVLSIEFARIYNADEIARLGAVLALRAYHGYVLRKLTIRECRGFDEGNVAGLAKAATEAVVVEWDEVEETEFDWEEEETEEDENL